MNREVDYLVMGIGSVGGVIASEMTRDGYRPALVTHNETITDAINTEGIVFSTPDEEEVHIPAIAHTKLSDLPEGRKFDAILLVMKTSGMLEAAREAMPYLKPNGYFVSFQNGLIFDELSAITGETRLLSAVVAFGSNMEAPGIYRRTTPVSRIYLGEMSGAASPRVQRMAKVLDHVVHTTVSQNIEGVLWGKLLWNCSVSALGALGGGTFGEVCGDELGRNLFLAIYRETMDVAKANYIAIENVVNHNPDEFYLPDNPTPEQLAELHQNVEKLVEQYENVLPSSLQSLQRGRQTETDFINGAVIRQAMIPKVATPINEAIVRMIGEIEDGKREIERENLDELMVFVPYQF